MSYMERTRERVFRMLSSLQSGTQDVVDAEFANLLEGELSAALAELAESTARNGRYLAIVVEHAKTINDMRAEAATARAMLIEYGGHKIHCNERANGIDGDCECGWLGVQARAIKQEARK